MKPEINHTGECSWKINKPHRRVFMEEEGKGFKGDNLEGGMAKKKVDCRTKKGKRSGQCKKKARRGRTSSSRIRR